MALLSAPARPAAAEPGLELQQHLDRYRQLAEDLRVTTAQTAIMQRQIADLQLRVVGERAAIGRIAAATYRGYRLDPLYVLADARSGGEILDRIQLVNAYAERRRQEIDALELTRARYEAVQRTLQSLLSQQRDQQQQLVALRLKIQQRRQ